MADRPADQTKEIEITIEMASAGEAVLRAWAEDCFPYWDDKGVRVAAEVFQAMILLSPILERHSLSPAKTASQMDSAMLPKER